MLCCVEKYLAISFLSLYFLLISIKVGLFVFSPFFVGIVGLVVLESCVNAMRILNFFCDILVILLFLF